MTPINKKQFKQALLDLALVYKRDFSQEISDLTAKKDVNEKVGMEREEIEQLKGYY
jgi:predicted S18 family serine protease